MSDLFDKFDTAEHARDLADKQAAASRTAPYVAGSDTSESAAESIEPVAGSLRARVLAFIRELRQSGLILDSGLRRKTRSGRSAVVWLAVTKSVG